MVNFLKFETKESILAKAWKGKLQLQGRQIFFDPDYPTDVMKKRKSYSEIKKGLKKICFQTPLSRIRIHWSDGPKLYNNAEDAARDMRSRGHEMTEQRATGLHWRSGSELNHGSVSERGKGPEMIYEKYMFLYGGQMSTTNL